MYAFRTLLLLVLICPVLSFAQQQNSVHFSTSPGNFRISPPVPPVFPSPRPSRQRTYTVPGAIHLTITTRNSTCEYINGVIIVEASGGTPPYEYVFDGNVFMSGNYPVTKAGDNIITVRDANGVSVTTTVTVGNDMEQPAVTVTSLNRATDCLVADGNIGVNVSGGLPPYQYSLDLVNFQAGPVFNGLIGGPYTVYVQDANGCVGSREFIHVITSCPDISIGWLGSACSNEGMVYAVRTGLVAPVQYSLDGINYQLNDEFTGLPPGVHTMYARGADGVVTSTAFFIYKNCALTATSNTGGADCGQSNGSLDIQAARGLPPYSYSIDGINFQPGNTFSGLRPGLYIITVKDALNATFNLTTEVTAICPQMDLLPVPASCTGADGRITVNATQGIAPFQYSLNGGAFQPGNVFTGLAPGNYTVTLRDANGNTVSQQTTVNRGCLPVSAIGTETRCGESNGSVTVFVAGGLSPFMYSLNGIDFQSSNVFAGLPAGNYTAIARDADGNLGSASVVVNPSVGVAFTATMVPAGCLENTGSVSLVPTAGAGPFQYSRNGGSYQPGASFTGLAPGNYTFQVRDANNCVFSELVTVTRNCPQVAAVPTSATCGANNGSIALTGSEGTAPYVFSINGIDFSATNAFSQLLPGNYTITIKDARDYINSVSVAVGNICPTLSLTATAGKCNAAAGSIIATAANGTAPYEFSINGGAFQAAAQFTGLTSGTYQVVARDANGLTATASIAVHSDAASIVSAVGTAAGCLDNDGVIQVQANGGVGPLSYSLDGDAFQSMPGFTGLAAGAYSVFVRDANGCVVTTTAVVAAGNNLSLEPLPNATICEGESHTLATISNASNYQWLPAAGLDNAFAKSPVASPSTTTLYQVTATLGRCTVQQQVTISVRPAPVADAGEDQVVCYGRTVRLAGSGGLTYEWSPATFLDNSRSASPVVQSPTATTTYSLWVTDAQQCRSVNPDRVTIAVTPPAAIFAGNDTTVMRNQPFSIMAQDVNNSGFETYQWSPHFGLDNPNVQQPVAILDREATYTVEGRTVAGCLGTDQIFIRVIDGPDIYVPSAFSPNNDGRNDVFRAVPVGIRIFNYLRIYNRFGQLVFETHDPAKGWDGKTNNQLNDTNGFVWTVEGIDVNGRKINKKGVLMLVR